MLQMLIPVTYYSILCTYWTSVMWDYFPAEALVYDENFSVLPAGVWLIEAAAQVEVIKLMKVDFSEVSQSEATLQMTQVASWLFEYGWAWSEWLIRLSLVWPEVCRAIISVQPG